MHQVELHEGHHDDDPHDCGHHDDSDDKPSSSSSDNSINIRSDVKEPLTRLLKVFTFFAALGGAIFGYDIGVISGAVIQLRTEFNLSTIWTEVIVSITVGKSQSTNVA